MGSFYTLYGNKLYLSNDNELRIVDIETNHILDKFDSGKQYIETLTQDLYLASSYIRVEKKYENLILGNDKQPVFEINGEFGVNKYFDQYLFLINRGNDKIAVAAISKKGILWESILTDNVNGRAILNNKFLIVPMFQSLVKFEIETGKVLWKTPIPQTTDFRINELESKLYSLSNNTFEIINVETGEREMQKELDLHVPAHLTYYADGYLYFSGYKGDNLTRIFGAVDVNTGAIAFTQSIEMPNGETYRGSYDRPVVVGTRLYIRDQLKTLHIYERQAL
jgi:outer membrane protein assembly factor BamB